MRKTERNNEAALLFGLTGKILYTYPTEDFYKWLDEENFFLAIPFYSPNVEYEEGAAYLKRWHSEKSKNKYSDMVTDYQNLFVGVSDRVKVPIWESVYVSRDPILFQDSTLEIRHWYARFGLVSEKLHSEPEDCAGQELMFFAYLLSFCQKKEEEAFFKEHINRWIPVFCGQMASLARTDFFKGVALLIKGAIKEYESMIETSNDKNTEHIKE